MNSKASLARLIVALTAFTGCDAMKKMIDPSGTAYGKPTPTPPASSSSSPSPSKPAPNSTAPAPTPTPAPSVVGKAMDVPIRQKAVGRNLTPALVESQIDEISLQAQGRTFRVAKGLFHDRNGITSLRDSSGRLWGMAIGDLNMDGSDDAVLILRTDRPGGAVAWDLAYLSNRAGRLFNVQSLKLPGDQGYRDVVIEGSSVLLVPNADGGNVHLGYSGGELSFVAR